MSGRTDSPPRRAYVVPARASGVPPLRRGTIRRQIRRGVSAERQSHAPEAVRGPQSLGLLAAGQLSSSRTQRLSHLLKEYSRASRGEASHVRPLLGEREHEVLRLVSVGYTDREIAGQLFISPRTVQNHLTRIREKTGLRCRAELTRWAMEHALT